MPVRQEISCKERNSITSGKNVVPQQKNNEIILKRKRKTKRTFANMYTFVYNVCMVVYYIPNFVWVSDTK